MSQSDKERYRRWLIAQAHPGRERWQEATRELFAADAQIEIVHPINAVDGSEGYIDRFLVPLCDAFRGLYRRDDIVMGGRFEDQDWISSTGYYAGQFVNDWLGLSATGELAYLRFGDFHRFEDGKIVESYVFLDLPQLMIATGQWPITESPGLSRGYTGFLPGPAAQDGLLFEEQAFGDSEKSYQIVTDMLSKLNTPDEGWRPYWHENMLWYGPAAFGSFIGVENFASFQRPFEQTFDDWAGGSKGNGRTRHFTRFGDGHFTCSGGWPSLSGVQTGRFLGQKPTNKMLYMRVCDWWRREGDLLTENWVFVDIPHVLTQMGVDLFEGATP